MSEQENYVCMCSSASEYSVTSKESDTVMSDGNGENFAISCACSPIAKQEGNSKAEFALNKSSSSQRKQSGNVKFCENNYPLVAVANQEIVPVTSLCSCSSFRTEASAAELNVAKRVPNMRLVIKSEARGLTKNFNVRQRIQTRMKLFQFQEN